MRVLQQRRSGSPSDDARPPGRKNQAIAGTLAVALMLLGTRWASQIGFPPIFLTDVLLFLAVVHMAFSSLKSRQSESAHMDLGISLWVFLSWAVVRFVIGGEFGLIALRDFAPYLYASVTVLAAASMRRARLEQVERTRWVLVSALWLHAAWFTLSLIFPRLFSAIAIPRVLSSLRSLHVQT